ncbi:MAG: 6-phosphogluconolactonase [bacterium]|nr:6-phosphogluconolactonase [bacterium]
METFPQIITVDDPAKGLEAVKELLYKKVNDQTLLLLSGGKTPKSLYEILAKEGTLIPKAVGMVDERSDGSNLEMIKRTGLLDHFKNLGVNFYPILSDAAIYDKCMHSLFSSCKKKVAIMGIGEDGHTAGLPPGISNFKFQISNNEDLVTNIDDFPGEFKKRISLTFKALSQMDLLIVLVLGSAKQNALRLMFEKGTLSEIPARFFIKPEIAKKTILITDQKI